MKISIGTICEIKNSNIKVMVIGYNKKVSQTLEHTFEYVGCLYPEGYTSVEKLCFFDGVHIEKVIFRGYDENRENTLPNVKESEKDTDVEKTLYTFDKNGVLLSIKSNNSEKSNYSEKSKSIQNQVQNITLENIDISNIE